ncbi:MAG: hypothetical protein R6V28_07235 [Nitriliruptoraceae bacterium]
MAPERSAREVDNVAPAVSINYQREWVYDEGDLVTVWAKFTDPGWSDTHTVEIDWGVPDDHPGEVVNVPTFEITNEGDPGPKRGRVTGTYKYGDTEKGDGFEVVVTVTDDDGGVGTDTVTLTVDNVAPTIEDVSHDHDTVDLGGVSTILAQSGDLLEFDVRVTDPGSDDLTLDADFGDGTSDSWESLVDPPDPDPWISPTVQPRDVTFPVAQTFADACSYQVTFTASDDDGGKDTDQAMVVVVGDADAARGAGYWMTEYREQKSVAYTPDTLGCFLEIVGQLSEVFHDEVDASTLEDAAEVLHPRNAGGEMIVQLDRQLLVAWVNVASGAIGYDELVDTSGDGVGDTPFNEVLAVAEEARLDPVTDSVELEGHKDILEKMNTS